MNMSLGKVLKVILFAMLLRQESTNHYLWGLVEEVLQNLVFIGMRIPKAIRIKQIKSFQNRN